MITIPVQVCGDHWVNPEQVKQLLESNADQDITLDLGAEGASLTALGITTVLEQHCQLHSIDVGNVCIANWPNAVEDIPFRRAFVPRASHFFWMSQRYWRNVVLTTHQHVFGFFVGRVTTARAVMLYDLYHSLGTDCLYSTMQSFLTPNLKGICLENINDWKTIDQQHKFNDWWAQCPINSIDQYQVNDQYNPAYNTNASLLTHYHRFDIEIVAETYTMGTTFFPTEKTVRPIMAGRPIMVYGPVGFLSRLRELGFETYHELWDESYDQLCGPARWQQMQRTIADLMSRPDRRKVIEAAQLIAVRNRQQLETIIERFGP